jgi:hypothetical protein
MKIRQPGAGMCASRRVVAVPAADATQRETQHANLRAAHPFLMSTRVE